MKTAEFQYHQEIGIWRDNSDETVGKVWIQSGEIGADNPRLKLLLTQLYTAIAKYLHSSSYQLYKNNIS